MNNVRVHNSAESSLCFYEVMPIQMGTKPRGLWYDLNGEWLDWCACEMPDWVRPFNFEIILNLSKVLIIVDKPSLQSFIDQFGYDMYGMPSVDWLKVAACYSGIEIRNYNDYGRNWNSPTWLSSWDVSSGCIWDEDAIIGSQRL